MKNELVAEVRKDFRKSVLKKLRKRGQIPAVAYGRNEETTAISIHKGDLLKALKEHGRNLIVDLNVGGTVKKAILEDYQTDILTQDVIHADFLYVDATTEIRTEVPVALEGEAQGVREGGSLQQVLYELQIEANVREIPDEILVNVADLKIGDSVKIADIKENYANITINHDDEEVILSVAKVEAQEEEEEAEETEPQTV